MLKPFKIKVENPEHLEAIQEFVFKHGYTWWSVFTEPNQEVRYTEVNYLYLEKSGKENQPALSATINSRFFDSLEVPEMWFYDGKLQDKPEVINDPRSYLMLLLGTDEDIEYKNSDGEWKPFEIKSGYRIKPKPRYCNGIELDKCLSEAPELATNYYYPDPMHVDFYGVKPWANDSDDIYWFELGFAYDSSESAAKHGQAMGITMEG